MNNKSNIHFLSLIIPVYKQEKTIVRDIKEIKKSLDTLKYDYEIIVVIDGDNDKSRTNIKNARLNKIKLISYFKNQGKSYAIQLGMKKAIGDYVMFLDAGREIDPSGVSMLVEHMEWYDADIIVGSKRHPASQVKYSNLRKFFSMGYYLLVKFLFNIRVKDTQAGIKIFKKKVLEKVLPRLIEKKFAGDLEMLVVADSLGFNRIYEAPIKLDYTLSSITSAATMRSITLILIDTFAIWYRKNILQYYKKGYKNFIND